MHEKGHRTRIPSSSFRPPRSPFQVVLHVRLPLAGPALLHFSLVPSSCACNSPPFHRVDMPGKYSHAFVLSNYESHSIIKFNRPATSKPSSSSSSKPYSPSSSHRSTTNSPRSNASSSRINLVPSPSNDKPERLRLEPHVSPDVEPERPVVRRRSSSVETQIYAPIASIKSPPSRNANENDNSEQKHEKTAHTPSTPEQNVTTVLSSQALEAHPLDNSPPKQNSKTIQSLRLERDGPQSVSSSQLKGQRSGRPSKKIAQETQQIPAHSQKPNLRHSSAVVVGGRDFAYSNSIIRVTPIHQRRLPDGLQGTVRPLHHMYGRVPLSARAFAPEGPPSPPATPESATNSSLSTQLEKPNSISSPRPVPERSIRRSSPERSSRRQSEMVARSDDHARPTRPKTSSREKSPTGTTFSITTRRSPFDGASLSASHTRASSVLSKGALASDADLRASNNPSEKPSFLFDDDDADLESLPSTLDFNTLPWCNHNTGPAIFRDGELNIQQNSFKSPALTGASSFDSAAPPPITLNRRMPPVFAESSVPAVQKTPKKPKPSIASLSFFRSAPKAILYSQTVPGTPPIPVSVSRTAVPSIPALFPDFKGQFPPPPPKIEERRRRNSRAIGFDVQKRGRSVPPKPSEKRKSWFKTDQLDKTFSMVQPDARAGLK